MTTPEPPVSIDLERARLEFEREKWQAEYDLRRHEIGLKLDEANRSRWINPLVIAVFAAAAAALGNAGVTLIGGYQQRQLEETHSHATLQLEQSKAELARILEVVKTSDPEQAAINLKFLTDTGLITDPNIRRQIEAYLDKRQPGAGGVSLPSSGSIGPPGTCSISGGGSTFEIKNISEHGCRAAAEASGVQYKWIPSHN